MFDEAQDEVEVVDRSQCSSGHFFGAEEVGQVGAGMVGTGIAGTAFVERDELIDELSIFDIDAAIESMEGTVASHAGRSDTVKEIAPLLNCVEEIQRLADTEQVARLVFWQDSIDPADSCTNIVFSK